MAANRNSKRAVETIIVASGNQDLINNVGAGGALPGGGTRVAATTDLPLMSAVNAGQVNLANGQLGIFSGGDKGVRPNNMAVLTTDTFPLAPEVYIAQGTATSQTPGLGSYPLTNNRPYEATSTVLGRNHVIFTGRVAALPSSTTWNIGETTAINTEDLVEYRIKAAYHGEMQDYNNSQHGYDSTTINYRTPDYTALGLVDDLDHFVQNFAYRINRNSRQFWGGSSIWGANEPIVAFATGQVANGAQDINNVAYDNGGTVQVFLRGTTQYSMTLTTAQVLSLRDSMPVGFGPLNIDVTTAGGAADAEYVTVMALDRDRLIDDRVENDKIRVEIGLLSGFNETVSLTKDSTAYEGEGGGRKWRLVYEKTAGQRKHAQFQRQEWPFIEVASGIVEATSYSVFLIEHVSVQHVGSVGASVAPKKAIILVPACETTTVNALEAYLNPWIKSCPSYTILGNKDATGDIALPASNVC